MKQIIFKNTETTLNIGVNPNQVIVNPIVFTDGTSTGLGILFPNETISWWNLISPCDIIAYWRGTEILKMLSEMNGDTLCYVYYAANRNIHSSDKEKQQQIIKIIGKKNYEEIMKKPIPEEIIQYILDNHNNEAFNAPNLWPIKDEYLAGTIEWREEFDQCGLEKPKKSFLKKPKTSLLKKLVDRIFS